MTLAFIEGMPALLSLGSSFMVLFSIAGMVVHLLLAIAVWTSRPPRIVLVPTSVWGLAVLFGGVTAVGIFWILHYGLPTRQTDAP